MSLRVLDNYLKIFGQMSIEYLMVLEENTMANKVMKVGIISRDDYAKRTIAIAKGT